MYLKIQNCVFCAYMYCRNWTLCPVLLQTHMTQTPLKDRRGALQASVSYRGARMDDRVEGLDLIISHCDWFRTDFWRRGVVNEICLILCIIFLMPDCPVTS